MTKEVMWQLVGSNPKPLRHEARILPTHTTTPPKLFRFSHLPIASEEKKSMEISLKDQNWCFQFQHFKPLVCMQNSKHTKTLYFQETCELLKYI